MKQIAKSIGILTLSFIAYIALGASGAKAATITLSGGCSVDSAIASANSNSDTGGCMGSGIYGSDTIILPVGTWSIGADNIITGTTTFTGAGVGQSILDGADVFQGLFCQESSGTVALNVSDLTVQNINLDVNPAISSEGCNMSIDGAEVTGNNIASYFNPNVDIQNSLTGNVVLDITDLYIHDSLGSGVMASGGISGINGGVSLNVNRYTIGNMLPSDFNGGTATGGIGLFCDCLAGPGGPTAIISNSTIDGVDMGVLIFNRRADDMTMTLRNTTISDTGFPGNPYTASSIFLNGLSELGQTNNITLNMINTLIAGHNPDACGSATAGEGTTTINYNSLGHNMSDDATCSLTGTGDQQSVGTLLSLLAALQNNGGATPTRALQSGSPAIDAGVAIGGISFDQRGTARPQGSASDIGAYEFVGSNTEQSPSASPNPSYTPVPSGLPGLPNTSARNSGNTFMTWISIVIGFIAVIAIGFAAYFLRKKAYSDN